MTLRAMWMRHCPAEPSWVRVLSEMQRRGFLLAFVDAQMYEADFVHVGEAPWRDGAWKSLDPEQAILMAALHALGELAEDVEKAAVDTQRTVAPRRRPDPEARLPAQPRLQHDPGVYGNITGSILFGGP